MMLNFTVLIAMLIIIFIFIRPKQMELYKTILITIAFILIAWINIPCFVSIPQNAKLVNNIFSWPFYLYNQMGMGYVVLANIMLGIFLFFFQKLDNEKTYSSKQLKMKYDSFIKDAAELCIIGRDLDFLQKPEYLNQRSIMEHLKGKCKMLCESTDDPKLIGLYHDLSKSGIKIRAYNIRDNMTNLKGHIKTDHAGNRSILFAYKSGSSNNFSVVENTNQFFVSAIYESYSNIYEKSSDPVIKYIALDLGGVYFNGELNRDFFDVLKDKYKIKVKKKINDKLCINEDLLLGKIDIVSWIIKETKVKINQDTKNEIMDIWNNIWKPNDDIKAIIEKLKESGYIICPFSNLDKENGDIYLINKYLSSFCDRWYFSYEIDAVKPKARAFQKLYEGEKKDNPNIMPYQILLIDDQEKNIEAAKNEGWQAIKFCNENEGPRDLIRKLRDVGVTISMDD